MSVPVGLLDPASGRGGLPGGLGGQLLPGGLASGRLPSGLLSTRHSSGAETESHFDKGREVYNSNSVVCVFD